MSQPTLAGALNPVWTKSLSTQYFVNSVAISDDGSRVAAGTFYHDYTQGPSAGPTAPDLRATEPPRASAGISPVGVFGIYCYDSSETHLFSDAEPMYEGVYWVALSADGQVAAAAGWYSNTNQPNPGDLPQGLLRIYNVTAQQLLLDYTEIQTRVNAVALSSDGSVAAAIAGNNIYIFNSQNGVYTSPGVISLQTPPQAIAVEPFGKWIAACDYNGGVHLIINSQDPGYPVYSWQDLNNVTMHSVAIAGQAGLFVVGADDGTLYVFNSADVPNLQPIANKVVSPNVVIRWVAISSDAGLVTAVFNLNKAGMLYAASFDGQNLTCLWEKQLNQPPNSTSTDAQGRFVTASDGFNSGGDLYLYDVSGASDGSLPTSAMSWPMFLSADGSAIAAGSDNGNLYYFVTPAS